MTVVQWIMDRLRTVTKAAARSLAVLAMTATAAFAIGACSDSAHNTNACRVPEEAIDNGAGSIFDVSIPSSVDALIAASDLVVVARVAGEEAVCFPQIPETRVKAVDSVPSSVAPPTTRYTLHPDWTLEVQQVIKNRTALNVKRSLTVRTSGAVATRSPNWQAPLTTPYSGSLPGVRCRVGRRGRP